MERLRTIARACGPSLVDVHAAVQGQVLRLVGQGIDVRARVLGHDDDAGGTGARLARSARVMAMQEVVEPRQVRRVRWRAGVPKLLEVEDARGSESVEEVGHYSR